MITLELGRPHGEHFISFNLNIKVIQSFGLDDRRLLRNSSESITGPSSTCDLIIYSTRKNALLFALQAGTKSPKMMYQHSIRNEINEHDWWKIITISYTTRVEGSTWLWCGRSPLFFITTTTSRGTQKEETSEK